MHGWMKWAFSGEGSKNKLEGLGYTPGKIDALRLHLRSLTFKANLLFLQAVPLTVIIEYLTVLQCLTVLLECIYLFDTVSDVTQE